MLALELIDRIVSLLREHKTGRRQLFNDHIHPLFDDLATVHADYMASLADLSDLVGRAAGKDEIRSAAAKRRELVRPVRSKAWAISIALNEAGAKGYSPPAVAFFVAVNDYFRAATGEPEESRQPSLYRDILQELEDGPETASEELAKRVRAFLSRAKKALSAGWSDVTVTYAVARRDLLN